MWTCRKMTLIKSIHWHKNRHALCVESVKHGRNESFFCHVLINCISIASVSRERKLKKLMEDWGVLQIFRKNKNFSKGKCGFSFKIMPQVKLLPRINLCLLVIILSILSKFFFWVFRVNFFENLKNFITNLNDRIFFSIFFPSKLLLFLHLILP